LSRALGDVQDTGQAGAPELIADHRIAPQRKGGRLHLEFERHAIDVEPLGVEERRGFGRWRAG
jgi:hypothetical protein